MLVLDRKRDQSLTIETSDGTITVVVSKTSATRVKLAVDAPPSVAVMRTEVIERQLQGAK